MAYILYELSYSCTVYNGKTNSIQDWQRDCLYYTLLDGLMCSHDGNQINVGSSTSYK